MSEDLGKPIISSHSSFIWKLYGGVARVAEIAAPLFRLFGKELIYPLPDIQQGKIDILFHAVSVGEVKLISPLVEELSKTFKCAIQIGTDTGLEFAKKLFPKLPVWRYKLDLPSSLKRIKIINPKLIVAAESEIWPLLMLEAEKLKIPYVLVSARITERALCRWRVATIFKAVRQIFSIPTILAKDLEDAYSFRELGANKIAVVGNLKFSFVKNKTRSQSDRNFKPNLPVISIISTHDSEEKLIVKSILEVAPSPLPKLIIIPRHPERARAVQGELQKLGLNIPLLSRLEDAELKEAHTLVNFVKRNNAIIVDKIGLVKEALQLSDLALVGGSFTPIGGHNFLEPLEFAVPTITGPFLSNFKDVLQEVQFLTSKLSLKPKPLIVTDEAELGNTIKFVMATLSSFKKSALKLSQNLYMIDKTSTYIAILRKLLSQISPQAESLYKRGEVN